MAEICEDQPSSDFYDVLTPCTNDELAPIVDTLVKEPLSYLKIGRTFERHYPDHVRYTDQIADEMYRFSLKALDRSDLKRPSYEDMVVSLCKRIGIPTASKGISEQEAVLLNTFVKQHLSSIQPTDRQDFVDEARVAASKASASSIFNDEWPTFASTLLQVIYLRRKLIEEGRILSPRTDAGQVEVNDVPVAIDENENSLVVQTPDGDAVLSLALLQDDGTTGWIAPKGSSDILNMLSPMLKAAQPFFSAQQVLANGNYVRVILPPGGAISFSETLGHYVGVAKGYKGMVPLDPISVASFATPLALLTLASAVAEQKKLENIEKSLNEIKSSLNDVSKFQQNERRSILTGAMRYFQQVAHSVLTGELASEVLHEIERHEVELVRVQEHLVEDIRSQITALGAIKKEGFGSGKYMKAIDEAQATLARMYDEVLMCIRARACGYQLLCAYPGRDAGKRARLGDISKALRIFLPTGEATMAMDRALREKMQEISSYESKALLLAKEDALFERVEFVCTTIRDGLKVAESEQPEQSSIDFKVEDGLAVAIRMS